MNASRYNVDELLGLDEESPKQYSFEEIVKLFDGSFLDDNHALCRCPVSGHKNGDARSRLCQFPGKSVKAAGERLFCFSAKRGMVTLRRRFLPKSNSAFLIWKAAKESKTNTSILTKKRSSKRKNQNRRQDFLSSLL